MTHITWTLVTLLYPQMAEKTLYCWKLSGNKMEPYEKDIDDPI